MEYTLNLSEIMSELRISAEEIVTMLDLSYYALSEILANEEKLTDAMIGKLFRVYGNKIFFATKTT